MSAPHLNLAGAGAAAPPAAAAFTLRGVLEMFDRRDFRPTGWIWGTSAARFAEPLKALQRGLTEALGATTETPGLLLATGATPVARSAARDAILHPFYDPTELLEQYAGRSFVGLSAGLSKNCSWRAHRAFNRSMQTA